jgi:hypothetical protein
VWITLTFWISLWIHCRQEYIVKLSVETVKGFLHSPRISVKSSGSVLVMKWWHPHKIRGNNLCLLYTIYKVAQLYMYMWKGKPVNLCSIHAPQLHFLSRLTYTAQILGTNFIMKLYRTPIAIVGSGHFNPSGTRMHLKPWFLYRCRAPMLFTSHCNAMARHLQRLELTMHAF